MSQICDISTHSRSKEGTQEWPETEFPSPSSKEMIGTAISGLFLGYFGFNVNLFGLLAPKML